MSSVRQWQRTVRERPRGAAGAVIRSVCAIAIIGALGLGAAVPAAAGQVGAAAARPPVPAAAPSPTPPPNPSDDDINSSEQQASDAAAEVGRLSGQVSATEAKIAKLQDDLELKQELANKANVDLDIAKDDAAKADQAAKKAAAEADAAGTKITEAEKKAAEFAAASFRNGSVLGSMTALLGADSPADLMQRDAMLDQVSQSQLNVIAQLQEARNSKANKDAAARAALDEAKKAAEAATAASVAAQKAQQTAQDAVQTGTQQLADLQTQLDAQQQAYSDALNNTASLKAQRDAYNQWLAEKKAEEERQRKAAEERARQARIEAAKQAAAAKAAAEAKARAEAEARAEAAARAKAAADALRAQQAREAAAKAAAAAAEAKHQQDLAAQAAADREAANKAAAAAAAQQQAAKAQADRAKSAAAAKRAADAQRTADRKNAAAIAAQKAKEALLKQATEAARIDAARKAKKQADELARIRGNGTGNGAYFQSCDAARAAGYGAIKKGQPGYRAALDPNGNGIACDASLAEPQGQGTGGGSYFKDCDAARAAGAAPLKKGDAGYRAALDTNGNGIACDGGISDSSPGTGGSGVPNDGSKGSIVVNAALRWLGTPYSWGGGNSSGPTYGIGSGSGTNGFDCSGLALYAWAQAGVSLPHYSAYQYQSGQHIARQDLQPGDLVFFANNTSDWNTIHHVAIYMGNGQLIEAPQTGVPVRIRGWRDDGYIGATRPGT